jgi:glycosyltransferase involved in cell wall biosynthesis
MSVMHADSCFPPSALPPSTTETRRTLAVVAADTMAWVILRNWLTALAQEKFEVHVACPLGLHVPALEACGFSVHPVHMTRGVNPISIAKSVYSLWRVMRSFHFDIVHTHGPAAGLSGRIAATLAMQEAVVCCNHGYIFDEHMSAPKRLLFQAVEYLLGRLCTLTMFVSAEDLNTALRLRLVRQNQAVHIWDGVNIALLPVANAADKIASRQDACIRPNAKVVGLVARLVKEKGIREFFEAAKTVLARRKDVVFLVVGGSLKSDRGPYEHELRRIVREAGLGEHFVFTGMTTSVANYMKAMDILVHPSYKESFGRVIAEAMCTGLPVIAYNVRGSREVIVEGVTGVLVPYRSVGALADAILYLLDHPEACRDMGLAGRRRAEALFDERMVIGRVLQEFRRIVAASRQRLSSPNGAI